MHEKTAVTGLLFTIFFLGLIRKAATTDQCNGPRQIPIQGNMLKGHIYETRWVRSGYAECLFICREEKVCQSFNFVVKESKCEFNNRTKEACSPEDFVFDRHRLYVKLDVSRVPLGSIPELPATSCQEINKNEGKKLDSGKYWMSLSGTIVHVYCNMSTVPEDIDECKSESHDCHVNANCINTLGSYNCTCRPGYKGNGTICTDIDECKSESHDCHVNASCINTLGSYYCSCWPGYTWNGTICAECQAVGVANPNRILNSQMNASSHLSSYLPYYGRLDEKRGAGAWCPKTWPKNRTDYLQVDLGMEHSVCTVATQGSFRYDEWQTSYILLMSKDGVTWGTYKENNAEKVFQGNTDRNTIVKHSLLTAVKARFVRFYYLTYHSWPALRVEIYVYV